MICNRFRRRTVGPKVDDLAAQQQHHAVKEAEAVRGGRMDGGTHGDARVRQRLDNCHDLQTEGNS